MGTWENMVAANVEELRSCRNSRERSKLFKSWTMKMIRDVVVQLGAFKKLNYAGTKREVFMWIVTRELDEFFQD